MGKKKRLCLVEMKQTCMFETMWLPGTMSELVFYLHRLKALSKPLVNTFKYNLSIALVQGEQSSMDESLATSAEWQIILFLLAKFPIGYLTFLLPLWVFLQASCTHSPSAASKLNLCLFYSHWCLLSSILWGIFPLLLSAHAIPFQHVENQWVVCSLYNLFLGGSWKRWEAPEQTH